MLGGGSHRLPPPHAGTPRASPRWEAWGCARSRAGRGDGAAAFPCPRDAVPVRGAPVLSQPGRAIGKGCAGSGTRSPWWCWSPNPAAGVSGAGFPPHPKPPPGSASLLDLNFFLSYFSLLRRGWVVFAHLSSHLAASPGCFASRGFKWALSPWLIAPGMICGGEGCSVGWR